MSRSSPSPLLVLALAAAVLWPAGALLHAQDWAMWVETDRTTCKAGETVTLRVLLEVKPGAAPIKGWVFGVCHDPELFKLSGIEAGTATRGVCNGQDALSSVINQVAGGFTAAAILAGPDIKCSLSPGCPYELAVATYVCTQAIDGIPGRICLCETLPGGDNNQPVEIALLLENLEAVKPEISCEPRSCPEPAPSCDCAGTEFWLAFPGNFVPQPDMPKDLRLIIASEAGANGQVEIPGLGVTEPFSVSAGGTVEVKLPHEAELGRESDVASKLGVRVVASAPVQVHGLNRVPYTADGFLGLPVSLLGEEYLVLAYKNVYEGGEEALNGSQFAVVATEDGTEVTIVPSVTTGSRAGGAAYTITLDRGHTYQLSNHDDPTADLSGTLVKATRPVAVFSGHFCATVPDKATLFCNHNVEQMPPVAMWGRRFVAMPLLTRSKGDTFRILASADGTSVTIDGGPAVILDRGQVLEHEPAASAPISITATAPILVAQHARGSLHDGVQDADSSMMLIAPVSLHRDRYLVSTPSVGFDALNFVNLVVPAGAAGAVEFDGVPIPAGSYSPPIGASGYRGVQLTIAKGVPHRITGPVPFGASLYGFDELDAYSYPACVALGREQQGQSRAIRVIKDDPCDEKPAVVALRPVDQRGEVTVVETFPPCAKVANAGGGEVGEGSITFRLKAGQVGTYELDISECCAAGESGVTIGGGRKRCLRGVGGDEVIRCCPIEPCDTHCKGIDVNVVDPTANGAVVEVAVGASDDSGDPIRYTFTATDGEQTITVGPQPERTALLDLPPGDWTITVTVDDGSRCDPPAPDATCTATITIKGKTTPPFSRGDGNNDLSVDLSDAIFVLNWLFQGGLTPPCLAAADFNGDASVNISDASFLLNFLFLGGPPLPGPKRCEPSSQGGDLTLGCEVSVCQ